MSVIIGIDPHKALHAASAIDRTETQLCELQVRTGPRQLARVARVGGTVRVSDVGDRVRRRARLSARPAARRARRARRRCAGDVVVAGASVGLGPVEQERRERRPCGRDRGVALTVAAGRARRGPRHRAALVGQSAPRHQPRQDPVRAAGCTRWCASSSPAGSAKKSLSTRPNSILAGIEPVTATQRQRLELAHETPRRHPRSSTQDEALQGPASPRRSTASATTLTDIFGVGPIIAAMIIGYTGDVTRFPTAGHYAAYNGTAPIEFSSSGRTVHRLSRRGNRTLNHAIHMIAVTQIRNLDSEGRAYYDRKLADGRTTTRSDALVEAPHQRPRLPPPARRRSSQVGPGGQPGNDSAIQRGRPSPERRHFGSVTPGPNTNATPRRAARHGLDPTRPEPPRTTPLTQRGIDPRALRDTRTVQNACSEVRAQNDVRQRVRGREPNVASAWRFVGSLLPRVRSASAGSKDVGFDRVDRQARTYAVDVCGRKPARILSRAEPSALRDSEITVRVGDNR